MRGRGVLEGGLRGEGVDKTVGGWFGGGLGIELLELKMLVRLKIIQWIQGFYIEVKSKSSVVNTWFEIESSLAMMLLLEE